MIKQFHIAILILFIKILYYRIINISSKTKTNCGKHDFYGMEEKYIYILFYIYMYVYIYIMTKNKHETVNFLRLIYPPNIHFLRNFTNFVLREPGFFYLPYMVWNAKKGLFHWILRIKIPFNISSKILKVFLILHL